MKTHKHTTKTKASFDDYIKAIKRGNREAEREILGHGFHSFNRIHKSKKNYSRKIKHRNKELP